jgi:hypothetical protein
MFLTIQSIGYLQVTRHPAGEPFVIQCCREHLGMPQQYPFTRHVPDQAMPGSQFIGVGPQIATGGRYIIRHVIDHDSSLIVRH